MRDTSSPFVSVIIPAFNEGKHLPSVLAAVQQQNYPRDRYEILLLDNDSTDNTPAIAQKLGIQVIATTGPVSAVRNTGVRTARGEVLAFLDADCLPAADWLGHGIESVTAEDCVTGAPYEVPPDGSWVERAWFVQKASGRTRVKHINGGNIFITRALFDRIGGFNEHLRTGEDAEFCLRARRAGIPVIADDSISVFHLGNPKTIRQFFRREVWLGLGAFGTFRHAKFDKPLLGTVTFLTATTLIGIGLILACVRQTVSTLLVGIALLMLLLGVTLWQRRTFIKSPTHAAQLALLYLIYFAGRSLSLAYLATGKNYYHHNKRQ
ncbi:MAG: glycosyltransferase [Bdellovibrionales bacterium]|nr:glycosyltransferase [Bdellovibrionales bacterium]